MHPESDGQKRVVAEFAALFDRLILNGEENRIEGIIREYNDRCIFPAENSILLPDLFFIWIGCIKSAAIEYIDIWRQAAGDRITVYYDGDYLLHNVYAGTIRSLFGLNADAPLSAIVAVQGHVRQQMDRAMAGGASFDQAFIALVRRRSPAGAERLEQELAAARRQLADLRERLRLVDIRDHPEVFPDAFFRAIYQMELVLRANAAAAADILRLLLLYWRGGVYVDVDTLPSLVSVFGPLSDKASGNVQNVVRSEYFLRRRRRLNGSEIADADILRYERHLDERDGSLLRQIRTRAAGHDGSPLPFRPIAAHADLIAMAALDTLYEYNNNLLAAGRHSRLVRILLREIRRRYRFLLAQGFDRSPNRTDGIGGDLQRLANYRHDALDDRDNVTLFLTGPILILEVMLGVAYEILPLQPGISPLALSYAFRLGCVSVACSDHTCYTPAHMQSSWR